MAQPLLLAIDIGTTNSKGALFTTEGNMVASSSIRHTVSHPDEHCAEHDPESIWWQECVCICQDLTRRENVDRHTIAGMAVSSLSPALTAIDSSGHSLFPGMLYALDHRADSERDRLSCQWNARLREMGEAPVIPLSIAPKILWLKEHEPEVFEKAAYFTGVPSFLLFKLTGQIAADYGCYWIAGFPYSRMQMRWDPEMCAACGITPERLPPLRFATEAGGKVTKEAAQITGLPEGIPVAVGTGDFLAETLSYGSTFRHAIQISFGTTVGVNMGTDHCSLLFPDYTPEIHRNTISGGAMSNGCSTIDWILSLISGINGQVPEDAVLREMALSVPAGAEGITILPYLNGEKNPFMDPHAKGVIFGLTTRHGPAHLYKASLESLAYSIRHCINTYNPAETRHEAVVMGGGTNIPQLLQTVSDVTGFTLKRLNVHNGTLLGDAFIAGMACGCFTDRSEIDRWVHIRDEIHPQKENTSVYASGYQKYLDLYEVCKSLMKD